MWRRGPRTGFTLAEVLVTLAILATLVAVLLPVLLGQISQGDVARVTNDVAAIRTGIGTFVSDVKRYPDSLGHLTAPVQGRQDINGADYAPGLAGRWRGPYLERDLIVPGDSLRTGFGATISGDLARKSYNGINYVTIQLLNLDAASFDQVDLVIDEVAGTSTGRFQVSGTTAVFFAMPVQ